tara:strand:- start:109 stop:1482 length:1374 start_codon:yes stop_codon:yes gene_type:complete
MKLTTLALALFSVFTQGQDCDKRVEEIFEDLIVGIGNNSIFRPSLEISNEEGSVAYLSDYRVTIEMKLINLFCGYENFDDKIAYILGHELAHHYLSHSWMTNTGLGYSSSIGNFIEENSSMYSKDQRKLSESQADLFAGFYGKISGYNTLANAKQTIKAVYEAYQLPKELNGYPSYNERLEIIDSKIDNANDLALIFEIGNVLLLGGEHELSKYCYEFILRDRFNSREIYNNLGLAYLLYGISISETSISKLLFPISLDQSTRAEVNLTRSANFTDNPMEMFESASKQFKKAQNLDSKYQPAIQNELVAEFLLLKGYKSRSIFIKSQNNLNNQSFADFNVINMIIDGRSERKIKKIAKKGSNISLLNISEAQNSTINYDSLLKKLGLSPMDLIMNNSKKIGNSNIKRSTINKTQIFDYKNLYIIKIPEEFLNNPSFDEEKSNFIKTNRGVYMLYNSN